MAAQLGTVAIPLLVWQPCRPAPSCRYWPDSPDDPPHHTFLPAWQTHRLSLPRAPFVWRPPSSFATLVARLGSGIVSVIIGAMRLEARPKDLFLGVDLMVTAVS